MIVRILLAQQFLLAFPTVQVFLHVFAVLHVKIAGKLGESLRKPLVVVALPADTMSPPLVRAFVPAKEIRQLISVLQPNGVALRGVQEGSRPQINQAGPALAVGIA